MYQVKITKLLLSPLTKMEETYLFDDAFEVDGFLLDFFESEQTATENTQALITRYNRAVRRFNKGFTEAVAIYTHPEPGKILRIIIDVYQKVGKEIGKLL